MTDRATFLGRIRAETARAHGRFPGALVPRPSRPREIAETLRRELAERWREKLTPGVEALLSQQCGEDCPSFLMLR